MNINVTCKVIDAPCGAGKTSAAINFINGSPEDIKFLFITPFLEEVERIKSCCTGKDFKDPDATYTSKSVDIKRMLKNGENIVSTHSLFRKLDAEALRYITEKNYVLIMDEVTSVVEMMKITAHDRECILQNFAHVDDKGYVIWDDDSYRGEYDMYMKLCKSHKVMSYNGGIAWVWIFPIETFNSFKEIYLLTYLFDAQLQKCYYDYYGLRYEYLNVDSVNVNGQMEYYFTDKSVDYHVECFQNLIDIVEIKKMNEIGDEKYALSKGWYDKASQEQYRKLQRNCYNFFRNVVGGKSKDNIWTVFKDKKDRIKSNGFTKGFLSLPTRSTNKYQDTYAAAYLVNYYANPIIKNFFVLKGIEFDEDKYALSELIQWLWRTRIRKGEPIILYIPSARMRGLLKNWLKGGSV